MRTPATWFALLLVVAAVAPASALAVDGHASAHPGPSDAAAVTDLDAATDAVRAVDTGRDAREVASDVSDTRGDAGGPVDALSGTGARFQTDDGDGVPSTTVVISLRSDRSAFWRVEAHYALETANETRAFRSIASRYESGDADVGPDAVLFEALQRRASESTGREMAIRNVTYHGSVDESAERGTLALTFRWTNFLRQGENETLVLDDVFEIQTPEEDQRRTWLSIFDADQQIRIRPPEGYTVSSTSIPVQQRDNAVVLTQPSDFDGESGALRITYAPVGPTDRLPIDVLAGAGVVALVAVVAGMWLLRRDEESDTPQPGDEPPLGPDNGRASEPAGGASPDGVADAEAGPDESGDEAADESESVDLSLLSDEERVEHLLEENGGRMKQATIVDEMGWSDAKVSQLLSAMAEEGRVDKLRLGRENLISLPDDGAGVTGDADDAGDNGDGGDGDANDVREP